MRYNLAAVALSIGLAHADYVCPANPSMTDAKAIAYGYTIQGLLESYYNSIPLNASFFSSLPNSGMVASNGMTLAENTVANVAGLKKQASLGAEALMKMGGMLGLTPPPCTYTFPAAPNGTAHLMNAYSFEATMCGVFIGLADYFQAPTLNFLSARLAAEHGIHASAIRAMMQPVGFMANSTMLTPAFTPDMVLSVGPSPLEVGYLGQWLDNCVQGPTAPCGGSVSIGPLLATLTGESTMASNATTGTMAMATATGTVAGASGYSATMMPSSTLTPYDPNAASSVRTGAQVGIVATLLGLLLA